MEFPDIIEEKKRLADMFCRVEQVAGDDVRVVASPYRICPLGAHIDHQGGPVLGMTINAYTLMAFRPAEDSLIRLRTDNYPGTVSFDVTGDDESTGSFWGVYPRAAALALREKYEVKRGIVGLLDGMLPGCGLSSSASVLLAYLHGLAYANGLDLEPWEFVNLTRRAEKGYIGLNNGILDQTSIVFGRKDNLLHINTQEEKVTYLPDRLGEEHYRIIVAFSGHSRELTTSGYNSRVAECRAAAKQLSQMAGKGVAERLSDVAPGDFSRFGSELEKNLARRSRHFFTECRRVADGVTAWGDGSIEKFGRFMNESCNSSMEQYECGIQAIYDLQQVVSSTEGVLGSRFMGGGFGGCVVGFVKPAYANAAVDTISLSYQKLHPETADQVAVYLARSDDGVRFI